ncbi:MAG: UTP--glucose-1-phosphate uridylyltransferase [Candidatus Berkelbacteria bacterium Licking1014_85]|uniref:UTP--glucose-1-phosphate uridylyltransferase n=1 Tax=Candidatus Berkelbacteria bacterium Licking1014_85 TaxID=2017148 RepID=A0A554LIW6_9BACT|nr:MAG: UTP--glucose-1-phosphate uridylyltransferase [Candidatus Berkelbacteria bacterium Licking1014_85]
MIKKLIIPAAGYGTRFLPWTKSMPKEMLPIIDRPVIEFVIREAVESGITQIILVTSSNKHSVEDYFDYNKELETQLKEAGKDHQICDIKEVADLAKLIIVRQKEQLGNGHAVLQAKEIVNHEPFLVAWGDEFMIATPPSLRQLIEVYNKYNATTIRVIESHDKTHADRYAFIEGEEIEPGVYKVKKIIEKPGQDNMPSNLASIGGYAFAPEFMEILSRQEKGKGNEIWLADAIEKLLESGQPVYAKRIDGEYFDCGNKLDYLKTIVINGLKRDDLGKEFDEFLRDMIK